MTKKYQLTKLQHKREKIEVTKDSLDDFLSGKRDDLDHIVMFENQRQIVTSKPTLGYPVGNYIPRYYSYFRY